MDKMYGRCGGVGYATQAKGNAEKGRKYPLRARMISFKVPPERLEEMDNAYLT